MRGKYRAQKGPSGPSKRACRIGKNESYCNYSSNFDELAYLFGVQILGATPMCGDNRVLGELSQGNGEQRKYKNQPRFRIDRDSQRKWEQAPISSCSQALESYWGIELIGLLVFAIWRILHTCTHRITCAENIEPKKGHLGPQKGPAGLEKMKVIAITAQILMSRHIPLVFRTRAPHPCMDTIGS